ncbi:hypothetical protein Bhyg_16209, partial [Pseudolycoriella hygida]
SPIPARPARPTICLYRLSVRKSLPMYGERMITRFAGGAVHRLSGPNDGRQHRAELFLTELDTMHLYRFQVLPLTHSSRFDGAKWIFWDRDVERVTDNEN